MFGIGRPLLLNLIDGLTGWFDDLVAFFTTYLPAAALRLIYSAWASVAQVLDCIQIIFQMLVGVIPVSYTSNSLFTNSGNLVMDIIMHPFVYNAFLRVLVIAFFLLLIFTFVAVLKSEYSGDSKQGNSKSVVIGKSLKAIFSFFFIPILCMFGIIASSYLVKALNYATSPTASSIISNQLFYSCAFTCNRARTDAEFRKAITGDSDNYDISINNKVFAGTYVESDKEKLAKAIDEAFMNAKPFASLGRNMEKHDGDDKNEYMTAGDRFANYIDKCAWAKTDAIERDSYFNTKNATMVSYFYDLSEFNWIIGLFSIFFLAGILVSITLGAAVRLYELAILFIISPAIMSMLPLDDGNAFKTWKKKFIGKTVMVFAPVVALNLYFILVTTLSQIDLSASLTNAINSGMSFVSAGALCDVWQGAQNVWAQFVSAIVGTHAYIVQQIFSLFIVIAGAMVTKESIKWMGDIVGSEDITGAGDKLRGEVSKAVQGSAAIAVGGAALKYLGTSAKGKMKDGLEKHADKKHNKKIGQGESAAAEAVMNQQNAESEAKTAEMQASEQRLMENMSEADLNADNTAREAERNGVEKEQAELLKGQFMDTYQKALAETGDSKQAYEIANAQATSAMTEMGYAEGGETQKAMLRGLKKDNQVRIAKMTPEQRLAKMKELEKVRAKKIKEEYKSKLASIASGDVEAIQNDEQIQQKLEDARRRIANGTATEIDKEIVKGLEKGAKSKGKYEDKAAKKAAKQAKNERGESMSAMINKRLEASEAAKKQNKERNRQKSEDDRDRYDLHDGKTRY